MCLGGSRRNDGRLSSRSTSTRRDKDGIRSHCQISYRYSCVACRRGLAPQHSRNLQRGGPTSKIVHSMCNIASGRRSTSAWKQASRGNKSRNQACGVSSLPHQAHRLGRSSTHQNEGGARVAACPSVLIPMYRHLVHTHITRRSSACRHCKLKVPLPLRPVHVTALAWLLVRDATPVCRGLVRRGQVVGWAWPSTEGSCTRVDEWRRHQLQQHNQNTSCRQRTG